LDWHFTFLLLVNCCGLFADEVFVFFSFVNSIRVQPDRSSLLASHGDALQSFSSRRSSSSHFALNVRLALRHSFMPSAHSRSFHRCRHSLSILHFHRHRSDPFFKPFGMEPIASSHARTLLGTRTILRINLSHRQQPTLLRSSHFDPCDPLTTSLHSRRIISM